MCVQVCMHVSLHVMHFLRAGASSLVSMTVVWLKENLYMQSMGPSLSGTFHYHIVHSLQLLRIVSFPLLLSFFVVVVGYDKILSFIIIIILFFNFTILYWFCHISTWIRHRYTCVPHPKPPFPVSSMLVEFWVTLLEFFFSCTAHIRMESSFLSLIISLINVTSSQPWGLMRKKCYPTSSPSISWDFPGSPVFMTLYF